MIAESLLDLGQLDWSGDITVRLVGHDTARPWFGKYHYSKTIGTEGGTFYGCFAPDLLAMVAIGPTSNAHGVAAKFGLEKFPGNVEITRVAVHPDSPRNTATKCVALVLKEVAKTGLEWLFSYADTGQGHHGGIYQALNAVYVGVSDTRPGYLLNGEPIHPRSVVSQWGGQGETVIRKLRKGEALPPPRTKPSRTKVTLGLLDAYVEPPPTNREPLDIRRDDKLNTAKHTYILPIGKSAVAIRKRLRPYAKSYPKGEVHVHRVENADNCRGCRKLVPTNG